MQGTTPTHFHTLGSLHSCDIWCAGLVHVVPVVYAGCMPWICHIILIGLVYSSAQAADIYRSKDSAGNVVFSDIAHPGAEKVILGKPTILPSQPVPKSPAASNTKKQPALKYESLTITSPADAETIRQNVANVNVAISARPGLQAGYGHNLQLLFDGEQVGDPGRKLSFTLAAVDRGSHTLQAVILEANGTVVMRSAITTFFVHKQSVARRAR